MVSQDQAKMCEVVAKIAQRRANMLQKTLWQTSLEVCRGEGGGILFLVQRILEPTLKLVTLQVSADRPWRLEISQCVNVATVPRWS